MAREDLIQQIYETMGLMKRKMGASLHPSMERLGISPAQIDLLFTIANEQPISPKRLASKLQLTPGAVSQLLAALQQNKSISLNTDPSDRRVTHVSISKSGEHMLESWRRMRHQHLTAAFEQLSDAELEQYLDIQRKLLRHFETESEVKPIQKEETA